MRCADYGIRVCFDFVKVIMSPHIGGWAVQIGFDKFWQSEETCPILRMLSTEGTKSLHFRDDFPNKSPSVSAPCINLYAHLMSQYTYRPDNSAIKYSTSLYVEL